MITSGGPGTASETINLYLYLQAFAFWRFARKTGFWLSVAIIKSPAIFVFLRMLSLGLKNEIDNLAYPPVFIPSPPTLNNFIQVFEQNSIGRYFWRTPWAAVSFRPMHRRALRCASPMQRIGLGIWYSCAQSGVRHVGAGSPATN